jgi:hypothetical protein
MAEVSDIPIFSDRLKEFLQQIFDGESPNAGRFCGYCYTPLGERERCAHCERSTNEAAPVDSIPDEVLTMYRKTRRRESLVVNGFAYVGLMTAVVIFIGLFAVMFFNGAGVWWYVFDIVLLFVLARVLAGLLGGFVGDEVGYRYARRKLAEDWAEYEGAVPDGDAA